MLTCKDASRLVSDGMDRPLALPQRLGLTFHLAICGACRRLRVQMHWLRAAARQYPGPLLDELPAEGGEPSGDEKGEKDPPR